PEGDLTGLAARALKVVSGTRLGASYGVRKRIPLGSGLGGGSSDAATALLVLNELWDCRRALGELAALEATLGADVPVFVQGSSAWAEGVGERLTPVTLPSRWYVIIHSRVAVRTQEVFQSAELTRNSTLITVHAYIASGGRKDCEPGVCSGLPHVAVAIELPA